MGDRPNILLVVTDQQRRDTIGAYGSAIAKTPHVDRLAAEGMVFDRAFTPCGLCSPVRASLLTGTYPHRHGVLTNVALHPVRQSLARERDVLVGGLKAAGYRLGCVGKWHVSHEEGPLAFGFDDHVGLGDYAAYRRELGVEPVAAANNYVVPAAATDPIAAEHSRPAFLADRTMELLERYAGGDRPFFLRLDFHGPHMPNVVPEPYASMYPPAAIPPHANFADDLAGKPAVQKIKCRHWGTDAMSWADWQPLVAKYLGEVSLLDAQLGRLLDKLDELGLAGDTLVVYTSDHGDTMGAHRIWNKDYTMYDEIYRVPLVARWPGSVAAGARCDEYVHHFLDLGPTFLQAAGADVPAGLDGESLLPLLTGRRQRRPREAFCQFHGCHMGLYTLRMLQTDRYKYVFNANDIDELYDHQRDPAELHNLAEEPAHAGVLRDMRRKMAAWMEKTQDHLYNEWIVYWLTGDLQEAARAPGRLNTPW